MKAWIVRDAYAERATVVFNDHGLAARRIGAEELDADFESVECDQAPYLDKYSDTGVPVEALIKEHGWWYECNECYKQVHDYNVNDAVFIGDSVYCSQSCLDSHRSRRDMINEEYEQFQISFLNHWPFEIIGFDGGYPCLTPRAYFTFPGAKFLSFFHVNRRTQSIECYVPHGDLEAYSKWIDKKDGR